CFLNIAYLKLHNRNDAEDAVQEAFCEIAHQPDKFFNVAPKNRVSYMVAVIRNIASDMFNKENNMPLEELDEEDSYDDNPFSFEDSLISKVSIEKLKKIIKSLPPLQRDVLTLRCLIGFSTAETAEKLNISQSAVKKRLHLAKEAVRKYVRKEDEIYE
ncbi:MAG: sigma-70 family RNA polymerase sigma factor, partial [Eubacterium sp.]|nr:sigma-70 family RNA polymerase sigma factor [Eubacterium sp.]